MNSYYEIHGHVMDGSVADHTSPLSSQLGGIAAERPERGRSSAKAESLMSAARDTGESRTGFLQHVYRTGSHPIREFNELPRGRQIGYLQNPIAFAVWGVYKQLEVIAMHYEYAMN